MLVQDVMTRQGVAISPDMPIGDVNALMEQRDIRHFPIVDEGGLAGIVSDRDIRSVGSAHPKAPEGVSLKSAVETIMARQVLTAHPLDPVEEAAKVLREHKIGALPVVNGGELVGIVSSVDLLDTLVRMTGVGGASTRLEVELHNRPGALATLMRHIAERNVNVVSVLTTGREEDSLTFVLRVNTIDGRGLAQALCERGFNVVWPRSSK